MGVVNFLNKLLGVTGTNGETIVIDIPASIYYKELAIYTASSYLANAVSMAEMRVFNKGKPVKDQDYYLLNVAPNKNENSNYFWHRVIRKMTRTKKGALVVELNGELHCAEDFTVVQERPVLGNIYGGVVLSGGVQLNRTFRAEEVYLFRMEDECAQTLIDGVYREYGKLLETAARTFKDTNGRKFKYKIDAIKAGDDEFQEQFKKVVAKNIKDYMENEYATYVEYDDGILEEQSTKSPKTSDDFVNIRKDIFEMVGQAFKIPMSMMMGNITNLKEVCDVFLTFGVNPLANTISEVLNKRATVYEYMNGNYYQCYTGGIKHRDLFESAANVEKLIGSAIINTDEAREELSLVPLNTPWSKTYYVTNNFREADSTRTAAKGGEEDE